MQKEWLLVLLLVIIISVFVKPYVTSGNPASRFATMQSVVEHGTFSIDNSVFMGDAKPYDISNNQNKPLMRRDENTGINGTNDKAFINGNFYSDKSVVSSLIGVPFYWILYNVFNLSFDNNGGVVVFLLVFILAVIPGALTGLFLFKIFRIFNFNDKISFFLSLAGVLSTLIFTYSVTLNNHILSTLFITIILYLLIKYNSHHKTETNKSFFLVLGFIASLNLFIDIVAGGIFLLLLVLYLLFSKVKKIKIRKLSMLLFVIGFIPVALIHAYFTIQITGDILPASLHSEYWNYPGSNFNSESLSGTTFKHNFMSLIIYGFHMVFGYRGFFLYSPILIFGIIYMYQLIKSKNKEQFYYVLLISSYLILLMAYYIFFTNNYGGWSYGVRWFVPLMPGIYIFSALKFVKMKNRKWFYVVLFVSFIFAMVGAYEPWTDMWHGDFAFINNLREIARNIL